MQQTGPKGKPGNDRRGKLGAGLVPQSNEKKERARDRGPCLGATQDGNKVGGYRETEAAGDQANLAGRESVCSSTVY